MISENLIIIQYIKLKFMDLNSQQIGMLVIDVLPATAESSLRSDKCLSQEVVILYVLISSYYEFVIS
jgi:hypothetical protein